MLKVTALITNTDNKIISGPEEWFVGSFQECVDELEVYKFQYDIQDDEIRVSEDQQEWVFPNNLVGYPKKGESHFSITAQ